MVSVPVNPKVLIWAREERGLSLAAAAERLELPHDDLQAFESGAEPPTLGVLQRIAAKYEIALAALLMPEPLPRRPMRDFRAFGGELASDLAPETCVAIAEADEYADVMSGIRDVAPDLLPRLEVPVYELSDSPERVAGAERTRLGVSLATQFAFGDERQAFLTWREIVEDQGIFSYQMKLGADGSRGFSIWDAREVPIIVVDSSEGTYAPKVFTLWHEYAHVLLRAGGISDQNRSDRTERFCNQFAAAFLLPGDALAREAKSLLRVDVRIASNEITRLARRFRISRHAVALRFEDLALVETGFYSRMVAFWGNHAGQGGGRASHEQRITNRLGGKYINLVLDALDRKLINKADAFEATRIKPEYFGSVRSEVIQRHAVYGKHA